MPKNTVFGLFFLISSVVYGSRSVAGADSFRSEVSAYFNLPFDYILKRALHVGAVSEEVAE
ncbi:MAG: hypothetical protein LH609_09260 [Rudanella sp.]|nr:hypothetical protein [Rudanella sp.]